MTPEKIKELGIGKRETSADTEEVYPWHDNPGDAEQYYGIFFSGMPDLNYDSEKLRIELSYIIHYWLIDIGVDGFRLDAARHIYPAWVDYNNQLFWWFFDYFVRNIKADTYTVGEIWAKGDEVAPYFKNLNSAFHFDISFIIQRTLVNETDEGLITKLLENYELFAQYNPDFIDALMLTNHDQARIASVVKNDIRKVKLAASILLTLPGLPYLYYGEEIGMLGPKPDISIREPFLWSDDTDDTDMPLWQEAAFSTKDHVKPLSVQKNDPESIFCHYKNLISLRKSEPALAQILQPNIEHVRIDEDGILAYLRPHSEKPVLVIHNLTGITKTVNLSEAGPQFNQALFLTPDALLIGSAILQIPEYGSLVLTSGTPA
jgi:alpha-amylase